MIHTGSCHLRRAGPQPKTRSLIVSDSAPMPRVRGTALFQCKEFSRGLLHYTEDDNESPVSKSRV